MKTDNASPTRRRPWSKDDLKELRQHSKAKTPVNKIATTTKRTPGALRAKAFTLGISIGHRRDTKTKR